MCVQYTCSCTYEYMCVHVHMLDKSVLNSEVSSFQMLLSTQMWHLGHMSCLCMDVHLYTVEPLNLDTIGAGYSVLNSEVSSFQMLLNTQMWHLRHTCMKVSCL